MPLWIPLVVLAALFNALWVALSKAALRHLPADLFTILFRSLTAVMLFPLFIYRLQVPTTLYFWLAVALAGIFESASIIFQSLGVRRDYYATFSIANISPFFTLLLAPHLLSEKVGIPLLLGVVFICLGVVVFFRLNWRFSFLGLAAAICSSLMNISSKVAIEMSNAYFFSFLAFTIGLVFIIPFSPGIRKIKKISIDYATLRGLVLIALFSFLATILYNVAIDNGPITRVSALVRINIIFGFLLSYRFLGERLQSRYRIIGGALIALGSVLVTQ